MIKKLFSTLVKEDSEKKTTTEEDLEACRALIILLGDQVQYLSERLLAVEKLAVNTAHLGDEIASSLTIIEHFLIEKDILPTIDKIELN